MNEAIYRERADAALQKIGMMLGTSDEWPDQESMISDVVSRVETALSKKYVQTSDKEARGSSAATASADLWDFCKRGKKWGIYPASAVNDGIDYFVAETDSRETAKRIVDAVNGVSSEVEGLRKEDAND